MGYTASVTHSASMSNIVIRKLDASTTIFSAPFRRFNLVPIGGRSTAITLASGKVVLFASTPNSPETESTLRSLGNGSSDPDLVTHIVAFDKVHNLYLNAKLVGVDGLVEHRKDLKFDIVVPRDPLDAELAQEFDVISMTGHPNEDAVWLHRPTKTVLQADVMFNLPSEEQGAKGSWVPHFLLRKASPMGGFHKTIVNAFSKSDPKGFAAAATRINEWDFDRIIPCHGDVIEGNGKAKEAWRTLFADFIKPNSQ